GQDSGLVLLEDETYLVVRQPLVNLAHVHLPSLWLAQLGSQFTFEQVTVHFSDANSSHFKCR
ncbi:MAG: hypothetical protein V1772_03140, partial [Chloroflexota bacterium]